MFNAPRTLVEATAYKYNCWGGNPKGWAYRPEDCAYEVMNGWHSYQCCRKKGHGPEGLYCKQHAKIVEAK